MDFAYSAKPVNQTLPQQTGHIHFLMPVLEIPKVKIAKEVQQHPQARHRWGKIDRQDRVRWSCLLEGERFPV